MFSSQNQVFTQTLMAGTGREIASEASRNVQCWARLYGTLLESCVNYRKLTYITWKRW